ncbi:hypothetical protein DOTSEDRAFT_73199 [Dothistroma septosporum NZE10]|uniref:Sulfotransferase domain-containing protein n=1 Tax=Dothistroma septosporum (strain NZE10 / CBS 128990) TaxID=675120 RepID=N1PJI9_DOTSN|nr:hypothetical protein DOTSEDRAFT_73199 [Dothistroma septosporum NZE10]
MSGTWAHRMSTPHLEPFGEGIQKGLDVYHESIRKAQADYQILLLLQDHPFRAADPQRAPDLIGAKIDEESSELFAPHLTDLLLKEGPIPIPILTIRDPRLAVPSAFRVLGDFGFPPGSEHPIFPLSSTTLWIRWLYNCFTAHNITPVLIDADDIMTANSRSLGRLAARLGLDTEAMSTDWDPPHDHVLNEGHLWNEEYGGVAPDVI